MYIMFINVSIHVCLYIHSIYLYTGIVGELLIVEVALVLPLRHTYTHIINLSSLSFLFSLFISLSLFLALSYFLSPSLSLVLPDAHTHSLSLIIFISLALYYLPWLSSSLYSIYLNFDPSLFSPCSHSHPLRSLLSIISLALSFSISFLLLPLFLCSYSRILLVISATLVSSLCRISPSFLSSLYISISPLSLPSVCPSLLLSLKMKGRDANEEVVLI